MAPNHYAQCPVRNSTNWPAPGSRYCLCSLIAKVERDLRAQIAADIEAAREAFMRQPGDTAQGEAAFDAAAYIARGES